MNVVVSGGTGFIGRRLTAELVRAGHRVRVLTRSPGKTPLVPGVREETWDGSSQGPWTAHIARADAVINFAGEPIAARRWTAERKARILDSRLAATRAIAAAIRTAGTRPAVLVNASAVGYYGSVTDGEVGEDHPPGSGFLSDVCAQWEAAARSVEPSGVRVVLLRIGIVLGDGGGALERMLLPFRFFLGGPLGQGTQWFPWVHRDDVTGAALYSLKQDTLAGPVNVAAPEPATMRSFAGALGRVMRRPSGMRVPGFVLRGVLGEMAGMLLDGQRVVPRALLQHGYVFRHPELEPALRDILRSGR